MITTDIDWKEKAKQLITDIVEFRSWQDNELTPNDPEGPYLVSDRVIKHTNNIDFLDARPLQTKINSEEDVKSLIIFCFVSSLKVDYQLLIDIVKEVYVYGTPKMFSFIEQFIDSMIHTASHKKLMPTTPVDPVDTDIQKVGKPIPDGFKNKPKEDDLKPGPMFVEAAVKEETWDIELFGAMQKFVDQLKTSKYPTLKELGKNYIKGFEDIVGHAMVNNWIKQIEDSEETKVDHCKTDPMVSNNLEGMCLDLRLKALNDSLETLIPQEKEMTQSTEQTKEEQMKQAKNSIVDLWVSFLGDNIPFDIKLIRQVFENEFDKRFGTDATKVLSQMDGLIKTIENRIGSPKQEQSEVEEVIDLLKQRFPGAVIMELGDLPEGFDIKELIDGICDDFFSDQTESLNKKSIPTPGSAYGTQFLNGLFESQITMERFIDQIQPLRKTIQETMLNSEQVISMMMNKLQPMSVNANPLGGMIRDPFTGQHVATIGNLNPPAHLSSLTSTPKRDKVHVTSSMTTTIEVDDKVICITYDEKSMTAVYPHTTGLGSATFTVPVRSSQEVRVLIDSIVHLSKLAYSSAINHLDLFREARQLNGHEHSLFHW